MTEAIQTETKHCIDRQLNDEQVSAVADRLSRDDVLYSSIFLGTRLAILGRIGTPSDGYPSAQHKADVT